MPDTKYDIEYVVNATRAISGIDQLLAKLKELDVTLVKVNGRIATLGTNTQGIGRGVAGLKQLQTQAGVTEKALASVGKGNSSLGSYTTRTEKAGAALKAAKADADAATTSMAGVGKGGPQGGGRSGGGGGERGAGLGTVGNVIGGLVGGAVRRTIGAVGEAGREERQYLGTSAEKAAEFREDLREYASLRGEKDPNDKIVREALSLGSQGGLAPGEISPFLTTYEGSAATGRMAGNIGGSVDKGEITKEKQEALEARFKVVGAQFAVRTGLDAQTAGDLTGVASTYKKYTSDTQLAGELGGMHYGLDQGRGAISPLARGELGQAGSEIQSGRVSGLPELGAFVGVASIASKSAGSSGTTYGQLSRFLNESGEGNEKQKEFIAASGMGKAKGNFAKLKAFRDYMAKLKPEDANTYLESVGYGNSTDRRSALGMVGNVDVLEGRIKEANRRAANGQETIDANVANQSSTATGNRRAETAEFSSEVELGMTGEKVAQAQKFARARMTDPHQPGGSRLKARGWEVAGDIINSASNLFQVSGEDQRVNAEVVRGLVQGGKSVGFDVAKKFPRLMGNLGGQSQDPQQFSAEVSAASKEIESRDGNPFGGGDDTKKAAGHLEAAAGILKNMDKDGNRPGPPGDGGAGVNPIRR